MIVLWIAVALAFVVVVLAVALRVVRFDRELRRGIEEEAEQNSRPLGNVDVLRNRGR